jgi:hydroxyacylglutathione hydrolase
MIFTQFVDDALGCASYLVGDPGTGEAVVVDPAFAIEQYLEEAERREVRIVRALETHTHADHLSGHGRLALEHAIPVSIHPAADAEYPHDSIEDGEEIILGDIVLRCIHTPGHRPEHCCFAVSDRSRGEDPWIVLTGDSLFVGDAARPDLAVEARDGAEGLFHSLRRLVELGDGVEVYPGHVAGSLCGKAMSSKASTTIGFERRFNPALAHDDVGLFIAESADISTPRPPNMGRIVEMNRGPFVGAQPALTELPAPSDGVQVLDVRPVEAFAAGHFRGALSVPVSGTRFSTKAAFVLDRGPVAVVAADEDEVAQATRARSSSPLARSAPSGSSTSRAMSLETGLRRSSSSPSRSSTRSSRRERSSSTSARRTSATPATSRAVATSPIDSSRSARPISRATGRSSRSARRVRALRSPPASSLPTASTHTRWSTAASTPGSRPADPPSSFAAAAADYSGGGPSRSTA